MTHVTMAPAMVEGAARYDKKHKLGEGTYATVHLAIDNATGSQVAIKKIRGGNRDLGVNLSALRELESMRELSHANVVQLLDVFVHKGNVKLVLEYLVTDLEAVIKDNSIGLRAEDIKSWMLMTIRGVHHCHAHFLLHRDLKPNNLLIDSTGVLKVADFGLARFLPAPSQVMTPEVVTRFYRAPELLFGAKSYGFAVDIWAIGCIFAELMLRTPYLAGQDSDLSQLETIFKALGTPTAEEWPDLPSLPGYMQLEPRPPPPSLGSLFTAASPDALGLLSGLLKLNPARRLTAEQALRHPYFSNAPLPTRPSQLRLPDSKKRKPPVATDYSDRPVVKRLNLG